MKAAVQEYEGQKESRRAERKLMRRFSFRLKGRGADGGIKKNQRGKGE